MTLKKILTLVWATGLVLVLVGAASAQSNGGSEGDKVVLDLKTAIKKALPLSPDIMEAQAVLAFAEARRDEARGYRWPQMTITGLLGPIQNARGNLAYSPDSSAEIRGLGIFTRLDAAIVQPIYTFGKISEGVKAAQKGVRVDTAGVEVKQAEMIIRVKEAYYGLQLAIEGKIFLDELEGYLNKARDQVVRMLERDDPKISEIDRYRVDSYGAVLENLRAEVVKGQLLAQAALAQMCGLPGKAIWPAEALSPVKVDLKALPLYKDQAFAMRPEMKQIREGLDAMESLVQVAKADRWPMFFVAGLFSAAWAPNRNTVDNPFVVDEFNHLYGGGALGAQWKLNLGITEAKVAQARADLMKIRAKEQLAKMYLPVQVTQAYLEIKQAEEQIEATRKAYTSARRWLIAATSNFDLGVGDTKDIVEGFFVYATQRGDYFKAVHRLNLAWAKLIQVTGAPGEV